MNIQVSDGTQDADRAQHCDSIEGITVPTSAESVQLTQFLNEACDQVSIRQAHAARLSEMYADDASITDIKKYFARPRVIQNIEYSAPFRGNIGTYEVNATNTLVTTTNYLRIQGAFGWRATFCFKLQAVSTPFQAGIVRLAFEPTMGPTDQYDRLTAITPVSQLPGVELDLAETTSVILKVPFIFPRNYFHVRPNSQDSLGRVGLFAMTPVTIAAGTPTPSFVLWHWLEDFELVGAAAYNTVIYEGQSGTFKANPSTKEEKAIDGNLSNVLAAGSKLVTWLSGKVPLISSYAGPTSWMLREASKIAASYGWSKPLYTAPVARYLTTANVYQHNVDGVDTSFNLGAFAENAVPALPGFAGTDVDEMALSYVQDIFAVISCPSLTTTQLAESMIYSCTLCPEAMRFQNGNTNVNLPWTNGLKVWPSPIAALSNMFQFYRGGFRFRVKIAKTKFHTGRILLGFQPATDNAVTNGNFIPVDREGMEFKSAIWDLREGNVMEFDCPFISPFAYLRTNTNYGTFFMSVIEPLRGPDTVAQTLPMFIEVAGASDLEFAYPITPVRAIAPRDGIFEAQAGEFMPYKEDTTTTHAANCIGEKINSVKQIISKDCITRILTTGTVTFLPQDTFPTWLGVPNNPTGLAQVDVSWWNYFSKFYAMKRGGVHYHLTPIGTDMTLTALIHEIGPTRVLNNTHVIENRAALHVKVPFYSRTSRVPTGSQIFGRDATLEVLVSGAPRSTQAIAAMRCADDFQFGYFVGAPPLTNWYGADNIDQQVQNALATFRS